MLKARGALRLFTDADGATPIQELERLESALAAGADIAIDRARSKTPRSGSRRPGIILRGGRGRLRRCHYRCSVRPS